jgi:flavorubredoxin
MKDRRDIDRKDDRTLKISESVSWVGILDYDIVTFDVVMKTDYGTTYNSYFINADKKTVIEGVKNKFSSVHISKLRTLTDLRDIKYIVLDHTEPDHSGNVGELLELSPDATVVGSGNAIRYLTDMLNKPFSSLIVKDGDTLDLGNRTLRFISAPNLHWPDSMFTYLVEEKILFTCDFFGAHYCSYEMITDFNDDYLTSYKYYFDVIIRPFSRFAEKALSKISGLKINAICPGHGSIHTDNVNEIISLTGKYTSNYLAITGLRDVKRVVLFYVTAYGYTKLMAERIAEGIRETEEVSADIMDIEEMPIGEMESELIRSDAVLLGSPTINQNTLLPVYRFFSVVNPLRDRLKVAGSYGSYGWSGEAPVIINETLKHLKFRVYDESAAFRFYPGEEKSAALVEFGRKFARFVKSECYQKGE